MNAQSTATRDLYFRSLENRDSIAARFDEVRRFTERLCEPLETEDYVVQSMEDASPTRWHLAHTTWFFETFVLRPFDPGYESPDPIYAFLFNSYYVQAGERYPRPRRGLVTRPTVKSVFAYRRRVDEAVSGLLSRATGETLGALVPVMELGLHHEQQHQELMLTDLKHLLSFNPLYPVYRPRESEVGRSHPPEAGWIAFPEGVVEVGHGGDGFCFDNETPRHRRFVETFRMADRLTTNGEFMEFIEDGGYREPTLWLDEGWRTVEREGWRAPLYWREEDGRWMNFTLSGLREVDPAEPVCHVGFFEADAFARWAGARLPSEAEWEIAAAEEPLDGNFVESGACHPLAREGKRSSLSQLYGDVWEWTASPYVAYPGFRPGAGALGEYNGKFMINQMVLRGGSCATSRSHIRKTYRNFFHPDKRWQFSGIRLVAGG
jgi:ergothioneine biosynthesis protein EgtB